MESGLEGRNNRSRWPPSPRWRICLNGVRPRRPEQYGLMGKLDIDNMFVSMESGLEGRNNMVLRDVSSKLDSWSQWSPA